MRVISGRARGTNLYSLNGIDTRPTLDRIKESLFNIIHNKIANSYVLDLFSGSGALGIECISRGAKQVVFCDKSFEAIKVIKKNLEKAKMEKEALIINKDYITCLEQMHKKQFEFDLIFIDPPYESEYVKIATDKIIELQLIKNSGIIIIETDDEKRIITDLENKKDINIYDVRKYGRVKLIFINRKG